VLSLLVLREPTDHFYVLGTRMSVVSRLSPAHSGGAHPDTTGHQQDSNTNSIICISHQHHNAVLVSCPGLRISTGERGAESDRTPESQSGVAVEWCVVSEGCVMHLYDLESEVGSITQQH